MTTKVHVMSNVSVSVDSSYGADKTITAISKATPGVITATHDFVVGDYVLFAVEGMTQLDGNIYRVFSISTTVSFQIEDLDGAISTVGFDTFISGTVKKVIFGINLSSGTEIQSEGGEFNMLDVSIIHNDQLREIPGTASAIKRTITHLWDLSDSAQKVLKSASKAKSIRAFKFTYGKGGPIEVFTGYVGYQALPTGQAREVIKSPSVITAYSEISNYGS